MITLPLIELSIGVSLFFILLIVLWAQMRREHKKNQWIQDISFAATAGLTVEDISNQLFTALHNTLGVSKTFIGVVEKGILTHSYTMGMEANTLPSDVILFTILELLDNRKKTVFAVRSFHHKESRETLLAQGIELMIPLVVHSELAGILFLGKKHLGVYNKLDSYVLQVAEPIITVSLKNALEFEAVESISKSINETIKKSQDEINAAKVQVAHMETSKDQFIDIASHELRTPITAIKGYLWLVLNQKKQVLDVEVKKNIETCYHSAERLLRMVSDMLTVSRIDEQKMQLNIQKVDIASLLRGLHEEMKTVADMREIEFTIKLVKPSLIIMADRERLQELFHNVIDNAIKFVPHRGFVRIDLQENEGRDISVLISDNGPGIPKEERQKLFTKFGKIQYSYDKTHAVEGAGLGLYISKKIVDLHSGIISVESEVEKGTTFIITLPFQPKK